MKRHDPVLFRQSLLRLLEAHPPREEQFLARFEKLRGEGQPVYSQLFHILTHLSFSESEARKHWRRVVSHRAWLKAELERDPGLRVAILDYFVNVNQALKNPKVIELAIYERTERSAVTDGLTGLFNHSYFLDALRREIQRSRRHGFSLALILLDLDDFKRVNDTRGHLEGDKVLAQTAAIVKQTLREIDIAARYGGEEFVVILPDTERTGCYVAAERIRRLVEERYRRSKNTPHVTISGGVATFPEDANSAEDLIQRADESLYRSKAEGKNRITLASGERRRHPRVPVSHRVTLAGGARRGISAKTKNASASGLLVSAREPVAVGSAVELVIHPQGGQTMGLRGEVVRVEASGLEKAFFDVGLRFSGDSSQTLILLDRAGSA